METKLRVLIVDDEPDISAVLRPILEPEFETFTASNGLDALLKLPRYEPDVLLVDIMMPIMDGWELAKRVRHHPDFDKTPIIFLTALDSRETIRKGYEGGADVYITKPFDPDRVVRNIRVFGERNGLTPRPKRFSAHSLRSEEARETKAPPAPPDPPPPDDDTPPPAASPDGIEAKAPAPAPVPLPGVDDKRPSVAERFPSPPRVLLVDDDLEVLDILRLALHRGFEVVTAHDGLDALSKIPEVQPDLYVVDVMMPKMSGFQLLQLIRQSADTRTAPVIILSGKTSSRDREHAHALGANAYLAKPFLLSDVVAELERQTEAPGFRVHHPKRKALADIYRDIGEDLAAREDLEQARTLRQTYRVLGQFIDRHGGEDPFGTKHFPS